jgi:clostripain
MTSYADYMFDIYDLFTRLSDATNDLSAETRTKCVEAAQIADEIVLASFLDKDQTTLYQYPFEQDKSGIAIFLPQNESLWRTTLSYNSNYIPDVKDAMGITMNGYGNFAWCIDGCEPSDNIADNWFELLDSWYDTTNDESGGLNYYQY